MASLPGTSNSGTPLSTDHERGGTKGEITTSVESSKEYFGEDLVRGDVMDHKDPTQPTSQLDLVHSVSSLYSATATPTVHAVLSSLPTSLTPAELEKEDAGTPILSPPTGFREPDSQNNTAGNPMEDSFVNPLSLDVHRQQEHLSPGRDIIIGNTSSLSGSPRRQRYIEPVCTLSEHCSGDSTEMCHGNCQLEESATLSPMPQPGSSVEHCPVEVSTGVEVPPQDNSTLQEVEVSTGVEVPPQDNSTLQEVEVSTGVEVPPQDNSTLQEVEVSTGVEVPPQDNSTLQEVKVSTEVEVLPHDNSTLQEVEVSTGVEVPPQDNSTLQEVKVSTEVEVPPQDNSTLQEVEVLPHDNSTLQEDYKLLYHKALEKIHLQAVELDGYHSLMSSVCEMAELKDQYLDCIQTASHEIDLLEKASQKELSRLTVEQSLLQSEYERAVAHLVVESTVDKAKCVLLEEHAVKINEELQDSTERLADSERQLKSAEIQLQSLQSKLKNERQQLQSVTFESEELMEFTECEKTALEDTVVELQHQLKQHVSTISELREEMKQLKFFLKREVTKTMRYQNFSERLVGQLEKTQWDESRKENLGVGVGSSFLKKTLAQWRTISMTGCEGLPEEVRSGAEERLGVEDKVRDLSEKLKIGKMEYARLRQAFQDYQSKASRKIDVLKSNLEKADSEISELDDLVDRVVCVMKENYSTIKLCPPLLKVLQDLAGSATQ